MYSEDELLPLSGIQHFAFCPRQWALIHIEQQWVENVLTAQGRIMHERAHNQALTDKFDEYVVTRSMQLQSKCLGLYGVADVVEFWLSTEESGGVKIDNHKGFWIPKPIEYKRGKPKTDDRDKVQLCAQAICIEEMLNTSIENGAIYYGQTKRREVVNFSDELRDKVKSLCIQMHDLLEKGKTPKVKYESKCKSCSLLEVCQVKIINKRQSVNEYLKEMTVDEKLVVE